MMKIIEFGRNLFSSPFLKFSPLVTETETNVRLRAPRCSGVQLSMRSERTRPLTVCYSLEDGTASPLNTFTASRNDVTAFLTAELTPVKHLARGHGGVRTRSRRKFSFHVLDAQRGKLRFPEHGHRKECNYYRKLQNRCVLERSMNSTIVFIMHM